MLGARQRMAGHEMNALGDMRPHDIDNMPLDRTHIGKDRALLEMGCDSSCNRLIAPHRRAQDHKVRIPDRFGCVNRIDVPQPERLRLIKRFLPPRRNGDGLGQPGPPRAQRDGRPDQPDTDKGEFLDHFDSIKSLNAVATAFIAASLPIEMRKPLAIP